MRIKKGSSLYANEASEQEEEAEGCMNDEVGALFSVDLFRFKFPSNTTTNVASADGDGLLITRPSSFFLVFIHSFFLYGFLFI